MTRRKLARIAVMFGPTLGLLAGCGGGGASKPLTEADFCAQKADAECQVTERCVSSKDACKTARMAICNQFVADAKMGNERIFVPGNVSACINLTKSVYAKTSAITPKDFADMDDACNYVFQGNGEVNVDHCTVKYDCAKRVVCDKTFCAMASSPKAVDQPCGNPGDVCATGNYCAMNTAGVPVCTAKGGTGEICDPVTTPCLENLRCAAGSCAVRVESTGACTTSDDCVPTAPYCDPSAGYKCDMGLLFAPNASSCDAYGGTGSGTGGSGGGAGGSGGGAGGSGGGGAGGSSGGGAGGNGGNQDAGPG